MILEILAEAEQELVQAALWYEDRERGLGRRLRNEKIVVAAIAHERRKPGYWHQRMRQ